MKTITGQPAGWYLCRSTKRSYLLWWNGDCLAEALGEGNKQFLPEWFHWVERLIPESEVAELRTELAASECLIGESVRGAEQVNAELKMLREQVAELSRWKAVVLSKVDWQLVEDHEHGGYTEDICVVASFPVEGKDPPKNVPDDFDAAVQKEMT